MATNTVTVSGMFGEVNGQVHTYFADSPVVIDISGLYWGDPVTSPFTIVRVEVIYNNKMVGDFRADTGGQTEISFDISSALRAIWSDYDYDAAGCEVMLATNAITEDTAQPVERAMREYSLKVYTEYLASDDGGVYTTTSYGPFTGGKCLMGSMTEWERSLIEDKAYADVSAFEHSNLRNGDASTKPTSSPERVGSDSITSWVDVGEEEEVNGVKRGYTKSVFYNKSTAAGSADSRNAHAPIVLRDSQPYVDFLFTNRRGAVETCSGMTKEAMGINTNIQQYSKSGRPSFTPSRSLMAIGTDGRRSWQMSSGFVTREWCKWWAMEFLGGKRKQWWMRMKYTQYEDGESKEKEKFVPVIIKPAKNDITIYDKTKQQMSHVDFTVTLALEG